MSAKLKAGIIGAGLLGFHHAESLKTIDEIELVAVMDTVPEKAASLASQFDIRHYSDLRKMLKSESLDVAIIATPDPFHKEPFIASAKSGVRAIICEKPLATNLKDARSMVDAAEKNGVQVFVNFANRFVHADMATRYVIGNNLIGKPVYADINLDDNISVPTMLWGDRSREWASRSSTAHFLMSHTIDLVRWYFEPAQIERVFAISQNEVLGYTPDMYEAFLFLSTGARVRLKSEWIRHMDILVEFTQYIGGAKGSIFHNKHGGFKTENGWMANLDTDVSLDHLRSVQKNLDEFGVKSELVLKPDQSRMGKGWRPCLQMGAEGSEARSGWQYFAEAIIKGTDSPEAWQPFGRLPTIEDGFEAVKIVSAIIKSAETGKTVKI